jgi:KDO2-lipid IV(A) lauroyltransferase
MPNRLLAPRYWPTWVALGVLRATVTFPYSWLIVMGGGLGALMRRLPLPFAHTARRNIELCLPALSPAEREKLLARHFGSLGISLFETAFTWWASPERFARIVRIDGCENLQAALARGNGVIVLTAHFTTLEIAGRILASVQPTSFLYRPTKNALLARVIAQCRRRFGGTPIPRDDIRAMITALKNNKCVWYAPDQSYRKKGAQMVDMFGIPAATNTFTSRLARMTGATVLPYFVERLPGAHGYRAVIFPPLDSFPSKCAATDTERFNHLIEAHVHKVPEQYLWVHRRFKGLSDDYPDYYSRAAQPAAPAGQPGCLEKQVARKPV